MKFKTKPDVLISGKRSFKLEVPYKLIETGRKDQQKTFYHLPVRVWAKHENVQKRVRRFYGNGCLSSVYRRALSDL